MRPNGAEIFFVLLPIAFCAGTLAVLVRNGTDIVALRWLVYVVVGMSVIAAASSFLAYFEDRVRNGYAWAGIFLSGVLGVSIYASIYWVSGVVCAASVCSGAIPVATDSLAMIAPTALTEVQIEALGKDELAALYVDFPTALYFAIVTFTTLGYGDLQPVPDLRLLAGLEAVFGYVFLGFLVGAAFHWASQSKDDVHINWKTRRMRVRQKVEKKD